MTLLNWWSLVSFSSTIPLCILQWKLSAILLMPHWSNTGFEDGFSDWQNSPALKILKVVCWGESMSKLQRKYVIWKCTFSRILDLEIKHSIHYKLKNIRLNKVILAGRERKIEWFSIEERWYIFMKFTKGGMGFRSSQNTGKIMALTGGA